ncbi:MAG: hypothetical protein KBE09_02800 [Candidatus Pacebacteria bacterium]|nr:hypothetical protein [Candidatus Paceibacterota bacterium]
MKKIIFAGLLATLVLPVAASAHQTRVIDLDGTLYQLTVGSLNEPVIVDDKTGLDLRVFKIGPTAWYKNRVAKGDIPKNVTPVEGLDETLTISISSGKTIKEMEMAATYGLPGGYQTTFYPVNTAAFTYHIEGMVEGKQMHQMFACNPAGHVMTAATSSEAMHEAEESAQEAHEAIAAHDDGEIHHESMGTTVYERGGFGCAKEKAAFGFPHETASIAAVTKATEKTPLDHVTFALAVLGVLGAAFAAFKARA